MDNVFYKSKWIWLASGECDDQYVDFFDSFKTSGGRVTLYVSADSNYHVSVNGQSTSSGQYCDFEHYKIYDTIDITDLLNDGINTLKITAYHTGTDTSRYRRAAAGLIYSVTEGDEVIAASDTDTLSRLSPYYRSGACIPVSVQLGHTFRYDATASETKPTHSALVDKDTVLLPRPIKRHTLKPAHEPKSITKLSSCHYLVDLGGELVGLARLKLFSSCEQKIYVSWGEHIKDGGVRARIHNRTFEFEYIARRGYNHFTERFLRIGARYIEVRAKEDFELECATIMPEVYETERRKVEAINDDFMRIYEASVRTLELCMMDHYVDCPWREQALYASDSRNQMLSGYLAFKGKNAEYARANLKLLGVDKRDDGLLSITAPSGVGKAIPSFSLHYVMAMEEYIDATDDTSLAEELYPKLVGILNEFISRTDGELPLKFEGLLNWNFYDWSEYCAGNLGTADTVKSDSALCSLVILALDSLARIAKRLGRENPFVGIADRMRPFVRKRFLTEDALFTMHEGGKEYNALPSALAVLAGVVTGEEAEAVCENIAAGKCHDCSLSANLQKYRALLFVDKKRYTGYVLEEIRKNYLYMLEDGGDTVWETILGEDDFDGAGSRCHGWSAISIYFLFMLGAVRYKDGEDE